MRKRNRGRKRRAGDTIVIEEEKNRKGRKERGKEYYVERESI